MAGSARGLAGRLALGAAAVVVVAAVAAVIASGVSLVRLASGSMSPTYPVDSVLVVRDAPAAEVRVGDVVTVTRDGLVPITHRVVEVEPGSGGSAVLVLRGDANRVADPEPYRVSRVGLVLFGVPFGGSVLAALQSPVGLAAASVVVAVLVLWAWWPRREPGAHAAPPPRRLRPGRELA